MAEAAATPAAPAPSNGAGGEVQQPAGEVKKPTTDVAAPPKPPEKRTYKLKVDGKEEIYEGTDEDIARDLRLSRASMKRLEEASKAKAEAKAEQERFRTRLKENTREALKELGVDPDEWLVKELAAQIQDGQMTPEQKEAEAAKRELATLKKQAEERTKHEEAQKQQQAADEQWRLMEPEFLKALESHPDIPRTRGTMKRIAEVGLEFLEAGIDLTPAQIVAEVAQREAGGFGKRLQGMPVELLQKMLTPQQVQAIAKAEAVRLRAARGQQAQEPTPEKPTTEPKKYLSPDEFLSQTRRK